MSAKTPSHVDHQVGRRIRQARRDAKLTQEQLGNMIGLTFQQVQKYEKGANRIGASRLYAIARILNTPVAFFFEGLDEDDGGSGDTSELSLTAMIDTPEAIELNRSFAQIDDPATRRRLADLVKSVAAARG